MGDGINDNGDNIAPKSIPLGRYTGDRATTDGTDGHGNTGDDELLLPLVVKSKLSKLKTREMELTTMATILRSNQHPRALRRG